MTNEEWLASLKPGDTASLRRSLESYRTVQVVRVTPSGQIVAVYADNQIGQERRIEHKFNVEGRMIGRSGYGWFRPYLVPIDSITKKKIEAQERLRLNREIIINAVDLLSCGRSLPISPARKKEILALVRRLITTNEDE